MRCNGTCSLNCKSRILGICLVLSIMFVHWRHSKLLSKLQDTSISKNYKDVNYTSEESKEETIVTAIVTCVGANAGSLVSHPELFEQPVTLVKSILISAKISKANQLEFHIFTDNSKLTEILDKNITRLQKTLEDYVHVSVYYHSVYGSVPQAYEKDFLSSRTICSGVRLFLPDYFSESLKQILYLDSDTIVTGNIKNIWRSFMDKVAVDKNSRSGVPLAAMVQNDVKKTKYIELFDNHFGGIPHVPPRGVNDGVMFMNLDAMRKFNWTHVLMKVFQEKYEVIGEFALDQRLLNIIFHDHQDRLVLFPCQYNFQHLHCEKGLSCKTVINDEGGIQIMHGAGGNFIPADKTHHQLYKDFKTFNLEHHEDVFDLLFNPLKRFYNDETEERLSCFGKIGKYLFKSLQKV